MTGIPKGFTKTSTRVTTSGFLDINGFTLPKGTTFFVLEMSVPRPVDMQIPVNIAIDNGTDDDALYPVTAINEDVFNKSTEEKE
tara:strand:- start:232 stop:483 length:252 start_codon:yes stop_codon:yes gene_type:complete